jgi:F-type H+-transporting ATPase subunit delta
VEGPSRASLALVRARLDELAGAGAAADEQPGVVGRTVSRLRGEPASLSSASDDLFAVADLLTREVGLRRALADPSVPGETRRGLLDRLLGDKLGEIALEALRTAAGARWSRPADLLATVEELGAEALLASEQAAGALDEVEDELFRFGRIVAGDRELGRILSDRKGPAEGKAALLDGLLSGKVSPVTEQLLRNVLTGPHAGHADAAIERLSDLASRRRGQSTARVTTAVALTAAQEQRLADVLGRLYGRTVGLQVTVDPDILGGLVVQVGDEVIDGSIAHRLEVAGRRLAG